MNADESKVLEKSGHKTDEDEEAVEFDVLRIITEMHQYRLPDILLLPQMHHVESSSVVGDESDDRADKDAGDVSCFDPEQGEYDDGLADDAADESKDSSGASDGWSELLLRFVCGAHRFSEDYIFKCLEWNDMELWID